MQNTTKLKVKGFVWGTNHGRLNVVGLEPTTFTSVVQITTTTTSTSFNASSLVEVVEVMQAG